MRTWSGDVCGIHISEVWASQKDNVQVRSLTLLHPFRRRLCKMPNLSIAAATTSANDSGEDAAAAAAKMSDVTATMTQDAIDVDLDTVPSSVPPAQAVNRSKSNSPRLDYYTSGDEHGGKSGNADPHVKRVRKKHKQQDESLPVPPYDIVNDQCVFQWQDKKTSAQGWVVIDSPQLALSGGGLFMHSGATLQEVSDVAKAMSSKLTVTCQPQVVGAKGGIRYPHDAADATDVLERFVRDNAGVICRYWATGGDLNTDHNHIETLLRKYGVRGTSSALDILIRGFECHLDAEEIPRILHEPVSRVSKEASTLSIPLNDYSAGYGAAIALKRLLSTTAPTLLGRARIVLQGFGTVGSTFALAACEDLKIGKIIAICGQDGVLIDQEGIDIVSLLNIRHAASQAHANDDSSSDKFDPRRLESCLSIDDFIRKKYVPRRNGISDEQHLIDTLGLVRADVLVPCAQRYILTRDVVKTLQQTTFAHSSTRLIVAGANNILPQHLPVATSLNMLDQAGIQLLPEWIANAGTAALFTRACSGFLRSGQTSESLQDIANDINSFMDDVLRGVVRSRPLSNAQLWNVAEQVAIRRRTDGASNLLGVRRLIQVHINTNDPQRVCHTLGKMGLVACGSNKARIAASSDDPEFHIEEAGGSSDAVGVEMTFTVDNLARARRVLEQEGVAFRDDIVDVRGTLQSCIRIPANCTEIGYNVQLLPHTGSGANQLATTFSGDLKCLDHYTIIVPDANKSRAIHIRLLGFTHLRTLVLNAGSAPPGQDDMLNHVMALPHDTHRVLVITQGLLSQSIFSKLLQRKGHSHIHHLALQVANVEDAFHALRKGGLETTSEEITFDLLSGLRQFFVKEEWFGGACFVEFIERAAEVKQDEGQGENSRQRGVIAASIQGDFKKGNMASLAQTMAEYVGQ